MNSRIGTRAGAGISAALCLLLACIFFGVNVPSCGGIFLLLGLLFGAISGGAYYIKYNLDHAPAKKAAAAAAAPQQGAAGRPPPPRMIEAPPMTSRGSGRLYVPEPLERYR